MKRVSKILAALFMTLTLLTDTCVYAAVDGVLLDDLSMDEVSMDEASVDDTSVEDDLVDGSEELTEPVCPTEPESPAAEISSAPDEETNGEIGSDVQADTAFVSRGVAAFEYYNVSLGQKHSGAIDSEGNLWMWGFDRWGQVGNGEIISYVNTPVKVMENVKLVATGSFHSGAIKEDGSLWMWGLNGSGQLGDGTTETRLSPVQILKDHKFIYLSLSHDHSAALEDDGSLWMWGNNNYCQVKKGTRATVTDPMIVGNDVDYVSINSRDSAYIKNGSLYIWGYDYKGELGIGGNPGDVDVPFRIMDNVKYVSLGKYFSGAIKEDGSLWMWGENDNGQLGTLDMVNHSTPVQIMEGSKFRYLSLGGEHSSAIKEDGTLWMWGLNESGQLGDGTNISKYDPVQIAKDSKFKYVSLGEEHSAAIKDDGSLWIWGDNSCGQLGNGVFFSDENIPIQIKLGGVTPDPEVTYHVTYDANGATGEVPTDENQYHSGNNAAVKGQNDLAKGNLVFEGWCDDKDGFGKLYNEGDVIDNIRHDMTLYAIWGFQRWGFADSSRTFGNTLNGYVINEPDYNKLTKNTIKATDRYLLDHYLNPAMKNTSALEDDQTWGGASYGMSASVAMIAGGRDSLADYDLPVNEKNLNDAKAADPGYINNSGDGIGAAESVINYYNVQQYLPENQNLYAEYISYTPEQRIQNIVNYAKAAGEDKPFVMTLFWRPGGDDGVKKDTVGHTVLGIGYRELNEDEEPYPGYKHCIYLYDPSVPYNTGKTDVNINVYCNDAGEWYYPEGSIVPDMAEFICATDDLSVIAPIDYRNGSYNGSKSMPSEIIAGAEYFYVNDIYCVNKMAVRIHDLSGVTCLPETIDANSGGRIRLFVPKADSYDIEAGKIDHILLEGDKIIRAILPKGGRAQLRVSGETELTSHATGDMLLELVDNSVDSLPYIKLEASNVNSLHEERTAEGILVETDRPTTLKISSDDSLVICRPEGSSVLIREDEEGRIKVFEKSDESGQYDKETETKDAAGSSGFRIIPDHTDWSYHGGAIKPGVNVYDGQKLLKQNVDYTVTYKNNVNVYTKQEGAEGFQPKKAPSIIVTGKGNYSGKETAYFTISPWDISKIAFRADDMAMAASKKNQRVAPVLYWYKNGIDKVALKEGKDYKVDVYNAADTERENPLGSSVSAAGNYVVRLTGENNFTGNRELQLTVSDTLKPVSALTVAKIPAVKYAGEQIRPEPVVKDGKKTKLVKDVHYTLEYGSNSGVGTGYVIIKGKPEGGYFGTREVEFKIKGTPISKAAISGIPASLTYTGKEITLDDKIRVYIKGNKNTPGKDLVKGDDYYISYTGNTNAGNGYVIIEGIGCYSGTVKKKFKIKPYALNTDTEGRFMIGDISTVKYSKGGARPEMTVTFQNSDGTVQTLKKGRDYTLSYKNNSSVNGRKKPLVTVTGKGNFKGRKSKQFTIEKKSLTAVNMSLSDKVYSNKANRYTTTVRLVDTDGKKLKAGKDYEKALVYRYFNDTTVRVDGSDISRSAGSEVGKKDVIPAGTVIEVTARAKNSGNYSGVVKGIYRIVRTSISSARISGISTQVYTGRPVTFDPAKIKVQAGGDLKFNEDYVISYSNNTKVGTATVTFRGTGNYGGSKTVKFKIRARGLRWWWK